MRRTMIEKILTGHGHRDPVARGEPLAIRIDQCLTQDSTGTLAWLAFEALGVPSVRAELVVSYCDHTALAFKGESTDDHAFLRTMASRYGARYSRPGNGVCHQVHLERFAKPGGTLLGADSHTPMCGGLGMLALGAGGMDVAVAMAGGPFHVVMPRIMRVTLQGALPANVGAKDAGLDLVRRLTVRGGDGFALEFVGPGVAALSVQERATIANMAVEAGVTASIFPSDAITLDYLRGQQRESDWTELGPDEDAVYDTDMAIDLGSLVPLVAMPHSPDNVVSIDEVIGQRVDQVFVGSCTNGSFEDIAVVARLLEGRKVATDVDVIISPGSRQVWQMLLDSGDFATLTRAGARIVDPGCTACIGMGFVPGDGHFALRTVNRNWVGRGGNRASKIALSGPHVAAVAALEGRLADPRAYAPCRPISARPIVDDTLLLEPAPERTEIRRTVNIQPIGRQLRPSPRPRGKVLIKLGDGVSTDAIIPAGPLTQHLRSNLAETARYAFFHEDPTFAERAAAAGCGFIVAGENYGQGSSREHAALVPWKLGIEAVLARSFARIHHANLVNAGVPPIEVDTTSIAEGDELEIDLEGMAEELRVSNLTQGTTLPARLTATTRERDILLAGGLLAYTARTT